MTAEAASELSSELGRLLTESTRPDPEHGGIIIDPAPEVVDRLEEILREVGWPTAARVGQSAAQAFGELAKSVRDVETKRRWLDVIRREPVSELNPVHLAQFEDGLRLLEGRAQLYGSMYGRDEHGDVVPLPIEDAERVDVRRAAIGLDSLEEELERMRTLSRR